MAVKLTPSKYKLALFEGGIRTFALVPLWDKEGDLVWPKFGIKIGSDMGAPGINLASGTIGQRDTPMGMLGREVERPVVATVEEVTGRPRQVLVVEPDEGLMELRPVIVVESLQAV